MSDTSTAPIIVTGNNVEVTEALQDYVNKKMERTLGKFSSRGAVIECDVNLVVNKNKKVKNAHKAEVTTSVKGTTIRCSEESPDMYASIDLVSDRLARKLRKYNERRRRGHHSGIGEKMVDALEALEEEADVIDEPVSEGEDFVDPEGSAIVTKVKSYDLSKPISINEAVFSLDYVDHDFYVFRNEETNEINVVYKRNAGGVGLIEPQSD